jgi:hypothetical protein
MSSSPTQFEKAEAVAGYVHPRYAESLAEFGTPRQLPRCGGWILQRQIPGLRYYDGMGCYPIFACQHWSRLHSDLESLRSELVSLSLVADPFGEYDLAYLNKCFDVLVPFKRHFVINLSRPMNTFVSSHHSRYARKALREVYVERCQNPARFINEWVELYNRLIERHDIRGIPAFSRGSLAKQLKVPGIVMFRAAHEDTTVGITLWYIQGNVGYYHLAAYSDAGYELRASFALFWSAIEHFASNKLQWLNLGAGAGVKSSSADGLTRFKRGWSTGTRTAYFCGRIFDKAKYSEVAKVKGVLASDYFPAYRYGEFN